jgi:hypothetical protein
VGLSVRLFHRQRRLLPCAERDPTRSLDSDDFTREVGELLTTRVFVLLMVLFSCDLGRKILNPFDFAQGRLKFGMTVGELDRVFRRFGSKPPLE